MNHWPEIWRLTPNNGYIIDARAVCGERPASVGSASRGGRSAAVSVRPNLAVTAD